MADIAPVAGAGSDAFGFNPETEAKWRPLLNFLYDTWWRVGVDGIENVPTTGRVILVANHAGILPYDSLIIREAVRRSHPTRRDVRPLVEDFVYYFPFLGTLVSELGVVRANQENARRLLADEKAVLVFPEGIKGIEKPYAHRYQLQRFGRGGFVRLALRTQSPIVPVAVVGVEETHPMLMNLGGVARMLGLPYLPVTPTFPLLGPAGLLPLPARWRIRFGKPILPDPGDNDPEDRRTIAKLSEKARSRIQSLLDGLLAERRSVWS